MIKIAPIGNTYSVVLRHNKQQYQPTKCLYAFININLPIIVVETIIIT